VNVIINVIIDESPAAIVLQQQQDKHHAAAPRCDLGGRGIVQLLLHGLDHLLLVQGKYEQDDESDYNIQQCIVGTHTSGAAQNYLKIIGETR
jgi:hypothetical protein